MGSNGPVNDDCRHKRCRFLERQHFLAEVTTIAMKDGSHLWENWRNPTTREQQRTPPLLRCRSKPEPMTTWLISTDNCGNSSTSRTHCQHLLVLVEPQ